MARFHRHLLLLAALSSAAACTTRPAGPQSLLQPDLAGWSTDIPASDDGSQLPPSFRLVDGVLISEGSPEGHLISEESYRDYRLTVEYRWPGEPGNCGILIHVSTPRRLYGMYPQSIECQMHEGNAGDFWCIGEDIVVPDMEERRGPEAEWGVEEGDRRRVLNLTDGSENAPGEWNRMVIECRGKQVTIHVNDVLVNQGETRTADTGRIAVQAEGARCEIRRLDIQSLGD
ncbi:MAG: 3-keto-disaccharide hydrolase [Planctomycetota bacterium]|jgi:hypothetical protein